MFAYRLAIELGLLLLICFNLFLTVLTDLFILAALIKLPEVLPPLDCLHPPLSFSCAGHT